MITNDIHIPVLLERCIELLSPALTSPGAVLVDATLGMGGHAEALLQRLPGLHLVGLDRDPEALAIATTRLAPFADRIDLVHAVYDELGEVLAGLGIARVGGILFDLGVSSLQLDRRDRGFSYARDAPLDMRMDTTRGQTAAELLAAASEPELIRIFREYGEEKLAARYAGAIVAARSKTPIERSGQLVALIQSVTPVAVQRAGHPAKRVFQALRIEVNHELSVLARALPQAIDALAVGGRMVVMAYQSLEDRIVKHELQRAASSTAPAGLPVELSEHAPQLRLLVRGAEMADAAEIAANPRAASVRLRAAERIREAA